MELLDKIGYKSKYLPLFSNIPQSIEKNIDFLVMIGRNGPEMEKWISAWEFNNLTVTLLGNLSEEVIS